MPGAAAAGPTTRPDPTPTLPLSARPSLSQHSPTPQPAEPDPARQGRTPPDPPQPLWPWATSVGCPEGVERRADCCQWPRAARAAATGVSRGLTLGPPSLGRGAAAAMAWIPWHELPSADSPALGPSLQPRHCPACCSMSVSVCHGPESEPLARRSLGLPLCLKPQAVPLPTLSPCPVGLKAFWEGALARPVFPAPACRTLVRP